MNILVTGGAGFIGSHLVDRLLAEGHNVTALDNFDPFYPATIKEANIAAQLRHSSYHLVRADIRDTEILKTQLNADFDIIVHLAAKAGVRPSIEDPVGYQQVNVAGTQNLLEFARERGIKRFVFASSSSVYGVNPDVPWGESEAGLRPISPYAATKVAGELLGHVYSHLYGIRFIGLRFFTVYGPRQRPDLAIHKFSKLILAGNPLPFFGDGNTSRDYTFVADIVDGIRAAMDYNASNYELFNLGGDHPVTLNELVASIEDALGLKATLDRKPEQPGDVPRTWADLAKSKKLLGYSPKVPLKDGLAQFAAWVNAGLRQQLPG
ncbi:MAG TPA: GDP-mannose 4,6-dehydratase [Verrucomicrobiota bacterium]|nr:GDP-mannose 4,6-dehydratase [Verrucomicrobiota bacterium]